MPLAFGFVDKTARETDLTSHGDLALRLGDQTWTCDSYYLGKDDKLLPGQTDREKVKAVLRRLLEQWLDALGNATDGSSVFLPYDFSDDYTGWLLCHCSGAEISVSRGWANVAGHAISPSDFGAEAANLSGFHVDGPSVRVTRARFTAAIRASLAAAV